MGPQLQRNAAHRMDVSRRGRPAHHPPPPPAQRDPGREHHSRHPFHHALHTRLHLAGLSRRRPLRLDLSTYGRRFRLRPTFDISGFNASTQVVLRAFQHYGLLLADNGSDWYFQGSTDNWWGTAAGGTVVSELKTIPAAQFEAVDEPGLQAAAGSYAAISCTGTPLFTSYFSWFDKATAGMFNDNIHLLNTGGAASTGCVTLGAQTVPFSLAAGKETYVTFPGGSIGGPVVVNIMSGPAVLASQRVQYYSSFNEVWAMHPSQAATTTYLNWFDKATPGMVGDNIHVLNPGSTLAHVTVSLSGATPVALTVGAAAESYATFPTGTRLVVR